MNFKELTVSEELIKSAEGFSLSRKKIKEILRENGMEFDKFTITERDSFDGFIAENTFRNFLKENLNFKNEEITGWSDENQLNEDMVRKILLYPKIENFSQDELNFLKNYFYDKWDIKLKGIRIDVKTAATHLEPKYYWTYGVPKIQIEKEGKDFVVLNYLIYDKDPKSNSNAKPIKCVLIGCLSVDFIKKNCPIKEANTAAGHVYQIENYETNVSDYKDVKTIFIDNSDKDLSKFFN